MFETYTVKFLHLKECSKTVQHLDKAVERSYGLQFNLKLTIHVLHDISMDQVLSKYKEMITFLEIPLRPNDPKYLMPSCDLKNLNELVVNSHGDTELGHKVMVEEMLSKYGEQLEHFGLTSFQYFEGYVMVPILPRLKSLDLDNIDINTVRSLVSKVSKQSILKLNLKSIPSFAADEIDEFVMPNINKIKLRLERPFSWALIKLNKETLVEIDVRKIWADSPIGEVEQINLPKLKILRINGIDKAATESLIKGGAQTLEKLYLYTTNIIGDYDFNKIAFPNLKYLYINDVDKAAAISLIKGGAQTLETLHLQRIMYVFEEIDFNDILFPNLKYLYLPGEAGNEIIRRAQDTLIELTVGRPWVTSDTRENNPIRFSKLKTLSIEKREDLLLLIGSASKSVTTLIIKGCCKTNQRDLEYLQIPHLKTLVVKGTSKTVILAFIKLGMNTITKLIIDGKVISSEKLNKLKHILKIVKNVTAGELDSILDS